MHAQPKSTPELYVPQRARHSASKKLRAVFSPNIPSQFITYLIWGRERGTAFFRTLQRALCKLYYDRVQPHFEVIADRRAGPGHTVASSHNF